MSLFTVQFVLKATKSVIQFEKKKNKKMVVNLTYNIVVVKQQNCKNFFDNIDAPSVQSDSNIYIHTALKMIYHPKQYKLTLAEGIKIFVIK